VSPHLNFGLGVNELGIFQVTNYQSKNALEERLKNGLAIVKEFLKKLYRVLEALPNPFENFSSFGIRIMYERKWKQDREYSLTTTPIPSLTAQNP